LKGEGIDSTPTSISPAGLVAGKRFNIHSSPAFRDGWFELQDEGSQIVSLAISPRPGNMVIDACAGAGGKALHLAELMRNKGEIVAIDVDSERLAELQRRADRAGVNCIRTEPRANLEPEPLLGKADIVLVDAPCSGVGTIRRNPRMKWSVTESMVDHFSEKQLSLLGFNSRFVKPGGRLVYSTCSLLLNENENVLHAFLNSHPEFTSDVGNLTGLKIDQGAIKLFPHLNETDGFFIAPMKRRKD
jgi:16S rRNA (cytosine967-C5)-methyltransferase